MAGEEQEREERKPRYTQLICHRTRAVQCVVMPKMQQPDPVALLSGVDPNTQIMAVSVERFLVQAPCCGPACALWIGTEGGAADDGLCGDLYAALRSHDDEDDDDAAGAVAGEQGDGGPAR